MWSDILQLSIAKLQVWFTISILDLYHNKFLLQSHCHYTIMKIYTIMKNIYFLFIYYNTRIFLNVVMVMWLHYVC